MNESEIEETVNAQDNSLSNPWSTATDLERLHRRKKNCEIKSRVSGDAVYLALSIKTERKALLEIRQLDDPESKLNQKLTSCDLTVAEFALNFVMQHHSRRSNTKSKVENF